MPRLPRQRPPSAVAGTRCAKHRRHAPGESAVASRSPRASAAAPPARRPSRHPFRRERSCVGAQLRQSLVQQRRALGDEALPPPGRAEGSPKQEQCAHAEHRRAAIGPGPPRQADHGQYEPDAEAEQGQRRRQRLAARCADVLRPARCRPVRCACARCRRPSPRRGAPSRRGRARRPPTACQSTSRQASRSLPPRPWPCTDARAPLRRCGARRS